MMKLKESTKESKKDLFELEMRFDRFTLTWTDFHLQDQKTQKVEIGKSSELFKQVYG